MLRRSLPKETAMLRLACLLATGLVTASAASAQTAASCAKPPCSFTTTTTGANGQTSTTTGTAIKNSSGQWTMQTQTTGQVGVNSSSGHKPKR